MLRPVATLPLVSACFRLLASCGHWHASVVAAALAHYRRRPSLGFSDCLVLEIARSAGHVQLGTFAKALGKIDGTERL